MGIFQSDAGSLFRISHGKQYTGREEGSIAFFRLSGNRGPRKAAGTGELTEKEYNNRDQYSQYYFGYPTRTVDKKETGRPAYRNKIRRIYICYRRAAHPLPKIHYFFSLFLYLVFGDEDTNVIKI